MAARKHLTSAELIQIRILKDPVAWAEATLRHPKNPAKPLILRNYQKRMIGDPSIRKVSRCGRRVGKCVYQGSNIITSNGPINVEELYKMPRAERPNIISFDENNQEIVSTKDYYITDNGLKPVYKIVTSTGRTNYATGNHPYLTLDVDGSLGWIQIDDMVIGDRLAIPSTYRDLIKGTLVGTDISKILGYLCGDGGTSQKAVTFTNFNKEVVEDIRGLVNNFDCDLSEKKNNKGNYQIATRIPKNNKIIRLCEEHGLIGKLATEKEIPKAIMSGTKEDIANFIAAYWDCDGWCSIQNKTHDKSHKFPGVQIGACSSSEKLANGIHHLLLRLGIISRLKEKKVKYKGEYRKTWQVTINDADNIRRFAKQISLISDKKAALENILCILEEKKYVNNDKLSSIPKEIWAYVRNKQRHLNFSNMQVCGAKSRKENTRLRTQYAPSREKLKEYAKNLNEDEYLLKLSSNDVLWDEVVSIEYIGEKQTYDLTVPKTHTFISDDIISHNTLSMVVFILWYAFTHENSQQVVATPYDSQVSLIFDMLKQFIEGSAEVKSSIKDMVKSPTHTIRFKNGATIKGFTAGTRSGAAGGSLRGQAADWLYMDEVDYMTDDDFETIYAIALEAPSRIGVWISSTPTGRRGKFWAACQEDSGWTEFYYPTMVNPEWDDRMEKELRGMYSEQGYTHEVLAEFGDETIGVFKKEFIDRARADYIYEAMPLHNSIRMIGVDWDKYGAATQIVVVEFNQPTTKFKVINRIEIPKGEWTFDNAVNKIIEINNIYKPSHIYIDRGYGEYQIETIRKHGMMNPETGLHRKVRGVHFNESIDLLDPFTKRKEKKQAKHFMVNQLQILFERDRLMISDYDDMIIKQLENYQVVKKTVKGEPIYTDADEHTLDCIMLCILGFVEKHPEIINTIFNIESTSKVAEIKVKSRNLLEEKILTSNIDKKNLGDDWDEPGTPPPKLVSIGSKSSKRKASFASWSTRGTNTRRQHKRKTW